MIAMNEGKRVTNTLSIHLSCWNLSRSSSASFFDILLIESAMFTAHIDPSVPSSESIISSTYK